MRRRNAAFRNGVTAAWREFLGRLLDLFCASASPDGELLLRRSRSGRRDRRRCSRSCGELGEAFAAGELLQFRKLVGAEIPLQAREPAGERRQRVRVGAALGDVFEHCSSVAEGWRLSVWESVLSCSQTPTASTMMNRSLALALGVTACELVGRDDPDAAPLHLLEEVRPTSRCA